MAMKKATLALVSIVALFLSLRPSLAFNSLPAGCDSDCVVTCFSNNKVWENKCLFICGCQGNCPSSVGDLPIEMQQFNAQNQAPIEVAPECDKACFTNCAISQYASEKGRSDYSECWVGCKCSIKSQGEQSFESKIQESGISLGLVAGIFWIVIIVIAVILWCKCYSSQSRLAEVAGPRADVYFLMKEQSQEQDTRQHRLDMFGEEAAPQIHARSDSLSTPPPARPPRTSEISCRPKSSISQI